MSVSSAATPIRMQLAGRNSVPILIALAVAAVCASTTFVLRSPAWTTFLGMIGSGVFGVSVAMLSPRWTTLRLGYCHLLVWTLMGSVTALAAMYICLEYNKVAGTDKTPWHIARISAAVFSGPMVGPVANPGAGESNQAAFMSVVLLGFLGVAALPFLLIRRPVPKFVAVAAWFVFLCATFLWFFSSIVSLGVFLS